MLLLANSKKEDGKINYFVKKAFADKKTFSIIRAKSDCTIQKLKHMIEEKRKEGYPLINRDVLVFWDAIGK